MNKREAIGWAMILTANSWFGLHWLAGVAAVAIGGTLAFWRYESKKRKAVEGR